MYFCFFLSLCLAFIYEPNKKLKKKTIFNNCKITHRSLPSSNSYIYDQLSESFQIVKRHVWNGINNNNKL